MTTVRDLLNIHQRLRGRCRACGHERVMWPAEVADLFGPDRPLRDIQKRLKCAGCGRRGRDGFIYLWPCSLDYNAWSAREEFARYTAAGNHEMAERQGGRAVLENLRKLAGGELGGDGPVAWPPQRRKPPAG